MLFKHQPQQMVRHIQTIYWQNLANYLSVFDHFVGLAFKGLTKIEMDYYKSSYVLETIQKRVGLV